MAQAQVYCNLSEYSVTEQGHSFQEFLYVLVRADMGQTEKTSVEFKLQKDEFCSLTSLTRSYSPKSEQANQEELAA